MYDDLISRKAVIAVFGDVHPLDYNTQTYLSKIKELPPVRPVARDINVLNSDLISRKAAIDALGERPMVWSNDDEYALGERNQYDIDRLAIETVPSAEPDIDMIHLQKEQAYLQGWEEGREALRKEGVNRVSDLKRMFNEPHKYIITITRKSDDSVVRVLKAVYYTIETCNKLEHGIPFIGILYEDADGHYRNAYYPLLSYNFEILDI